ncbi:MAG: DUF488 family protein, N3 subclade [Peptostreptococcaceae bacterium]
MDIVKFSTFYKIPYEESEATEQLIDELSTIDFVSKEQMPLGYFLDTDMRFIRVPRGFGERDLKRIYGDINVTNGRSLEPVSPDNYYLKTQPYDEQEKVISKTINYFRNDNGTQAVLNIPTGRGKTYSAINIIHSMRMKPLIMVKSTDLAKQWVEAFVNHTNIDPSRINNISGYGDIMAAQECADEYDVFIITHASIRNFIKERGYMILNTWLLNLGIGIKIFDEFDLEVRNILRMDCHSSIKYTIYLTATFFKSSWTDNKVYKASFKDLLIVDSNDFKAGLPNRQARVIFYESSPDSREYLSCFNFNQMFIPDKYMGYVVTKPKFVEALKLPVDQINNLMRQNDKYKFIFFVGKIANCHLVKEILHNDYGFSHSDIGVFNSEVSDKDKDVVMTKRIIVTTSKSMGRGLDIKGLKLIVNCEAFASGSIFKQLTGRIGRHGGEEGFYYELVDLSFKSAYLLYKKREMLFKEEFKRVEYNNLSRKGGHKQTEKHSETKGQLYTTSFWNMKRIPPNTVKIAIVRSLSDKMKATVDLKDVQIMQGLSPSFKTLGEYKKTNDWGMYTKNFANDMRTQLFGEALSRVMQYLDSGHNVCLLCYEKNGEKCHRSIIAREIKGRGYEWMEV